MNELANLGFTVPWHALDSRKAAFLAEELRREISSSHVLSGQIVLALAQRQDRDEVLFRIEGSPPRYAVVHLTWSKQRETSPKWPTTELFESLDQFLEQMRLDSEEFNDPPGEYFTSEYLKKKLMDQR
jgi:hypothetical protein